jgi:hypothetical protein
MTEIKTPRNPKFEGTQTIDCKPQKGLCPLDCNQCFYNRPNAFYVDPNEPIMPTLEEVGDGIVRVNSGHDSNIDRNMVIESTKQYLKKFYNTSIPKFDFPAPVVFTANRCEEKPATLPGDCGIPNNLMFVRLRISPTNLSLIDIATKEWTKVGIPVVLTFIAYYTIDPRCFKWKIPLDKNKCYEWRIRTLNPYYCATPLFMNYVLQREKAIGEELVNMCGTLKTNKCKDCGNCETYYNLAVKHMKEMEK